MKLSSTTLQAPVPPELHLPAAPLELPPLQPMLRQLGVALYIAPAKIIKVAYDWPLLLFTDGAFEEDSEDATTVGGVALCPASLNPCFPDHLLP